MDRLKTEWDKGVSKMKTLGQERKEEPSSDGPKSAADISREDLLQLTMKLGARLKAALDTAPHVVLEPQVRSPYDIPASPNHAPPGISHDLEAATHNRP